MSLKGGEVNLNFKLFSIQPLTFLWLWLILPPQYLDLKNVSGTFWVILKDNPSFKNIEFVFIQLEKILLLFSLPKEMIIVKLNLKRNAGGKS